MIDLHCHLDLYKDALLLLPEVAKRNLFTLVVTTSPRAWLVTSGPFSDYENIKVAVGLHPEIAERKIEERELLISCISKAVFVGEVGIDGSCKRQVLLDKFRQIILDMCRTAKSTYFVTFSSLHPSTFLTGLLSQCSIVQSPII